MSFRKTLDALYTGRDRRAARFRYGLMALDVATILFFILTAPLAPTPVLLAAEAVIGLVIAADLLARFWIAADRWKMLRQAYTLADIVVLLSIIAEPLFGVNLAFLKVLRALRLIHSYRVLRDLRRDTAFFRDHEHTIIAAVDLFVFIFVATSMVFVLLFDAEPGFAGYVDALYFTVATLTTTGYGDITPISPAGKLLSVAMMVIGVALFFRLARAIFVPPKISHRCLDCGLNRHDPDAVHCKHCGRTLRIETGGAD